MFAKIAYKKFGSLAVKSAIILNNFGICCAYFRIFGDVVKSILCIIIKDDNNFFCNNWNSFFYIICLSIIMFPFIFRDNIESLEVKFFLLRIFPFLVF